MYKYVNYTIYNCKKMELYTSIKINLITTNM